MTMLDVFNDDAFSCTSLTQAINKAPYKPNRLGELGIFEQRPLTTTTAVIEEKQGVLSVLPTAARGTMETVAGRKERKAYAFPVPHIPYNDAVLAAEVQDVRAFGSETELETVSAVVNDKLIDMRANHEVTFEWHRVGALKGKILDAGGEVLFDLWNIYSLTQDSTNFILGTSTTEIKTKCTEVIRKMDAALGATPYSSIHVICGDSFFDKLVSHALVKSAYERWMEGAFLRDNQVRTGFPFAGLFFENYRGNVGGTAWIDTDRAYAFPVGVRGLFAHYSAPADFIETVNTRGLTMYAKQERMPFDKGIQLHTQSNPLILCTRPKCLQELYTSN
jgi:hypothetical protein